MAVEEEDIAQDRRTKYKRPWRWTGMIS